MEKLATDASSLVARATAASGGRASDLGPRPRIAAGVGARRTGPGRELDPGNKNGFGTSKTLASKVWFTRGDGELTEVYSPDLGTPSARDLQFVVSDGSTFTENERDDATHETQLIDLRSLIYRQVNTARSGCWRITKTYVTDPGRSAVLVDVTFESLTGRPYQLYALYDPALSNTGDDDRGESVGDALGQVHVASDRCCFDEPPRGLPAGSRRDVQDLSKHLPHLGGRCCFASRSGTAADGGVRVQAH